MPRRCSPWPGARHPRRPSDSEPRHTRPESQSNRTRRTAARPNHRLPSRAVARDRSRETDDDNSSNRNSKPHTVRATAFDRPGQRYVNLIQRDRRRAVVDKPADLALNLTRHDHGPPRRGEVVQVHALRASAQLGHGYRLPQRLQRSATRSRTRAPRQIVGVQRAQQAGSQCRLSPWLLGLRRRIEHDWTLSWSAAALSNSVEVAHRISETTDCLPVLPAVGKRLSRGLATSL